MPESPDLAGPVTKCLKELSTSMKAVGFYPSHHPAVSSSLERVLGSLREALALTDTLKIGVAETAFLLGDKPLAQDDRLLSGFAAYLNRRGIGSLVFRSPLDAQDVKGLLEVVALDARALRARGGAARCLAERGAGPVGIEEFDAARALEVIRTASTGPADPAQDGGSPAGDRPSWSGELARFLTGSGQEPAGCSQLMRRVAGDPQATQALLAALQEADAEAGGEGSALVGQALGRIAATVASEGREAVGKMAENLGRALFELHPSSWPDILQGSIPVEGTDLDLARETRARLPDDRVAAMIVALVRSEKRLSPRLATVVRKVLVDASSREKRSASIRDALGAAGAAGNAATADLYGSIEKLLEETTDPWISREYKGFLELLGSKPPEVDPALKKELEDRPGFSLSLTPRGIRLATWILFGDLVEIDREPARQWVALDEITRRAGEMDPGWVEPGVQVVTAVRALLTTPPLQPHVREAGERALGTIAGQTVAISRRGFHDLTPVEREAVPRLFEALGQSAVEPMIAGLKEEEDWEIRRTFIGFLAARGREAIPALAARISDASWFLVRNVLNVLGEIADPATVTVIAPTLRHPEPRVRRDAVAALGKIGGPRAFALVQDQLHDPEVHDLAVRCLASIDRPRAVAAFLEKAVWIDPFGRGSHRLRDVIDALGALGAQESVGRLESILLRNAWFPPGAGDTVRIAAARALARIGTTDALKALARGTRLWRRPVRAACSEIVGPRPGRDATVSN